MKTIQNLSKNEHWKSSIINWKSSGKSMRQWCLENKISPSTFEYWKNKFSSEEINKDSFIELPEELSTGITIKYHGFELYVEKSFDEHTLCRCLKVMRSSL